MQKCSTDKRIISVICLLMTVSMACVFAPYAKAVNESDGILYCTSEYASVLGEEKNIETVSDNETLKYFLNGGKEADVFDFQAQELLKADDKFEWYPQYTATVAFLADKSVGSDLQSWSELLSGKYTVCIEKSMPNFTLYLLSMAYAINKDETKIDNIYSLIGELYRQGVLSFDNEKAQVKILLDYQGAAEIAKDSSYRLIIPKDGTLKFKKGIISKGKPAHKLIVENAEDADAPLNNRALNIFSYPSGSEYESAKLFSDSSLLLKKMSDMVSSIDRKTYPVRIMSSSGGYEHAFAALLMAVVVTFWISSVVKRTVQKNMKISALLTGICMVLWIIIRFIKWQSERNGTAERYMWYSFYIFILCIPLLLLQMALGVNNDGKKLPKWYWCFCAINGIMLVTVITNDLHGFVFKITELQNSYSYSYGIGYIAACVLIAVPVALSVIILLEKCRKSIKKKAIAFPIVVTGAFIAYTILYILHASFIEKSDLTIVSCLFILLFYESAMQTGMIPQNVRYRTLFNNSPLKMQIISNDGTVMFKSVNSMPLTDKQKGQILPSKYPLSIAQDENTIIYSDPISGGSVVWQEDIKKLNELNKQIEESILRLEKANKVLEKKERLQRIKESASAKTELYTALDEKIASQIQKISDIANGLPEKNTQENTEKYALAVARIGFISCYVKRRCNLMFCEMQNDELSSDELVTYISELGEFAENLGICCAANQSVTGNLPAKECSLYYDFYFSVLNYVSEKGGESVLLNFIRENDIVTFNAISNCGFYDYNSDEKLRSEINSLGAEITLKSLGDADSITMIINKGGRKND